MDADPCRAAPPTKSHPILRLGDSFIMRALIIAITLVGALGQEVAALPPPSQPPWQPLIWQAQHHALHSHSDWLKLLHYEDDGHRSNILSADFFISPDGNISALNELRATLRAYFEPIGGDPNDHPRCRFPARYFWLQQHLDLGPSPGPAPQCDRLLEWARFDRLTSVSLLMVSGYFGNPASSFGHSLIRLNNGTRRLPHGLLDLGINYGALVPDNENTLVYVARGLLGGYEAGFSDKLYYTQDRVYSRTEFRDMWEYELNLTDEQLRLFVYHLWEIVGKKFRYYFLKENCAYRFAELLELVTGKDFLSRVRGWYVPVEIAHRLREIDAEEPGSWIRKVQFIPSSQRLLYGVFDQLRPRQAAAVNAFIRDPDQGLATDLGDKDRRTVLDTLLAYYQYRLAGRDETTAFSLLETKALLLRQRLTLPAANREVPQVVALSPPSTGSRPSALGLGRGYNHSLGPYLWASYAAFHYDVIGNNNLGGSELVVMDLAAGYNQGHGLFLDRLDLVRSRKLNLNTAHIAGESRLSWLVRLGLERARPDCSDCLVAIAEAGLGRAVPVARGLIGYAMVNGSLVSAGPAVRLTPNLGMVMKGARRWSAHLHGGYEIAPGRSNGQPSYSLETRYSVASNHELRLAYELEGATGLRLSWQYFR